MKPVYLILALLLAGSSSYAADTAIAPKEHTCSDLQQLVLEKRSVLLKGFFNSTRTVHAYAAQCDSIYDERAIPTGASTKDKRLCKVGYICKRFIGRPGPG